MPGLVRIERAATVTGPLAAEIAEVTRASYLSGDLAPGLPAPDGSRETGDHVRADLKAGRLLWFATTNGRCVGSVRASAPGHGAWVIHRLAVAPQARGTGVGLRLLRTVESAALAAGMLQVELDAVVERGTPAFYAAAGYRVTRHFAAPDKALSEVRMRRSPGARPQRHSYPAGIDDSPASGVLVSWWAVATGTACHLGPARAGLAALLAGHRQSVTSACGSAPELLGVDCWAGAPASAARRLHADLGSAASDRTPADTLRFDSTAITVAAFAQPRQVRPELLAWWRMPAARTQADQG